MPDLSIILPLYQVEAYLGACLESLSPMPADRVEWILVDDGSRDRSREIAESAIAGRAQARLLTHPENRGLSAARNTGLGQAQGTYVLFLDSDDVIDAPALLALLDGALAASLDIAQGAYETFGEEPLPPPVNPPGTEVLEGPACLEGLLQSNQYEPMVWQRLFRRAFLLERNLWMPEGRLHEDELFTAPAFLAARRVQIFSHSFYRYRIRGGGIMGSFTRGSRWCEDYLYIARTLRDLSKTPPPSGAKAGLRQRAADIALSIAKNIVAYGLTGEVRKEALTFLCAHRKEIAALARARGGGVVRVQVLLLRLSPRLLLWVYGVVSLPLGGG